MLLPDDVLQAMVQKAMEEAFFKPRKLVDESGYRPAVVDGDPWLVEVIRDLIDGRVRAAAKEQIKVNEAFIQDKIDELIKDGLVKGVISHIDTRLSSAMGNFARQAVDQIVPNSWGNNGY